MFRKSIFSRFFQKKVRKRHPDRDKNETAAMKFRTVLRTFSEECGGVCITKFSIISREQEMRIPFR